MHRWLGYWTILLTALHSGMFLVYYLMAGTYEEEAAKAYWIWGVVGTVCGVALWPCSLLVVRQKAYEVFLCTHQFLVVFFIVGYYYHIWERYGFKWGYEIWVFVAIALWALERLARLLRAGLAGMKTATVSMVDGGNGEYLRVDVENTWAEGVAYLYFPTLGWRVWENHPFSIASSFWTENLEQDDAEKGLRDGVEVLSDPAARKQPSSRTKVTMAIRVRSGMTARLAARASAAGGSVRIPIFLEASYHSSAGHELTQCTRILCIAGGVGLSAVLPVLHRYGNRPARLCWGIRNEALASVFKDETDRLPASVHVETHVGSRMDVNSIITQELTASCGPEDRGPMGVMVCGPPGMADDVRNAICRLARESAVQRGLVFVDETFSW
jgi:predicted ferric reductase